MCVTCGKEKSEAPSSCEIREIPRVLPQGETRDVRWCYYFIDTVLFISRRVCLSSSLFLSFSRRRILFSREKARESLFSLEYFFSLFSTFFSFFMNTGYLAHTAAITPSYAENSRETAFYIGNGNLCRANVLAKFKVQLST